MTLYKKMPEDKKPEILRPDEYKDLIHINFNFNVKTDQEKIEEVHKYEGFQIGQTQKSGILILPALPGRSYEDIINKYDELVGKKKAYLGWMSKKTGVITLSTSDYKKREFERERKRKIFLERKYRNVRKFRTPPKDDEEKENVPVQGKHMTEREFRRLRNTEAWENRKLKRIGKLR